MIEDKKSRLILLGEIFGAHGIRGDVLVRCFTASPAAIAAYGTLTDASGKLAYQLKILRVTDKGVVARINGTADRTAAERLKGTKLYVARASLPDAGNDEFYHADLIGLRAERPDGTAIGTVAAVVNYGAGDLIEIAESESKTSEFIPFTRANVPEVHIAAGYIVVDPPVTVGDPEPADPEAEET